MNLWIAIAALGGILSLAGIAWMVRQYRRGLVSGLELGVLVGAYALVVGLIMVTEVFQSRPAGSLFVVVMLPLWYVIATRSRSRPGR